MTSPPEPSRVTQSTTWEKILSNAQSTSTINITILSTFHYDLTFASIPLLNLLSTMASLPLEAVEDFTPEQVKSLYPQDLTLQYVQIFFRHGCPLTSFSNGVQVSGLLSENDFNKLVSLETGVFAVRRTSSVKQLFIRQDNFILCNIIAKSRFLKRTPGSRT